MQEEYISGYLECISRVKDIYTERLGGINCFFGFEKDQTLSTRDNFLSYLDSKKDYYLSRAHSLEALKANIVLTEIDGWSTALVPLIETWTCDRILETPHGKNGFYLSEYLVMLLKTFFNHKQVRLYKVSPDNALWPWGDMMSEEYLFETEDRLYILHFGESS